MKSWGLSSRYGRRSGARRALLAILALSGAANGALAQSAQSTPAIVIFPLVVNDADHDTVIQLAKLIKLKNDGLASVIIKGKGAQLPLPGPTTPSEYFIGPVRSVLVKRAGIDCWEAEHGTPETNRATEFFAT